MPKKIEISHKSIIFAFFFLLFLWFLYFIRDILLQFFVGLLIAMILNPLVSRLSKYRIPRPISILVSYLLVFGVIGYSFAGVAPPLIDQTASFSARIPDLVENSGIKNFVDGDILRESLSQLSQIPGQVARIVLNLFSNILSVLTVLIFAFYFLLSFNNIEKSLAQILDATMAKRVVTLVNIIEKRIGSWARGQVSVMVIVGLLTYLGLLLLGFPFAAPLALLAGLFEIIPYIGPLIAAFPPVIIGFGISPFLGVAAITLTLLVQQLENFVIVPKVMGKSVGLSPLVVLFALAVGFRLAGFVGIIISIPVIIVLQETVKIYLARK